MGWITCVCCEKFRWDFVARTFALIAPIQPISHRVSCSNETIQNAPKHYKMHQWVYRPMGWIGCVRCEKFQCDLMAQTCPLIAPVQHVLHQVSCNIETLPNAPKHYEMHQNKSLGSNGVNRLCSLPKMLMRVQGSNFCINCTNSAYFAPSFMQ